MEFVYFSGAFISTSISLLRSFDFYIYYKSLFKNDSKIKFSKRFSFAHN